MPKTAAGPVFARLRDAAALAAELPEGGPVLFIVGRVVTLAPRLAAAAPRPETRHAVAALA